MSDPFGLLLQRDILLEKIEVAIEDRVEGDGTNMSVWKGSKDPMIFSRDDLK